MRELLLVLIPTLFVGSIFSSLAGGGLGIIMIILFTFFFDIQTSVVFMALLGFIVQPAKALLFFRFADWRIIRWYVLLGFPCSYVGGLLLFDMPMRVLEISIAALCTLFIAFQLSKWKFTMPSSAQNLVIAGACNGFQGGLMGLGNLARNPLLLSFGIRKERFLGTAAFISIILNIGKTAAYIPSIEWTSELITMLIASIIPTFSGVFIGKKMHKFLSESVFEYLLLFAVALGIVKLLLFP